MPNDDRQSPLPDPAEGPVANPLVTVESQREFDLLSGRRSERTFLKMYVAARTSGLLAAISDRDWKTLCTLATYMDEDGYCFPSQAELARALGCSRQMANERVNSLARFRFNDKPVLLLKKDQRSEHGRWAKNGYYVLPIASLSIFGDPDRSTTSTTMPPDDRDARSTVSRNLDTVDRQAPTVSSQTVTVGLDTNQNHITNQKETFSKIRKASPSVVEETTVAPLNQDSDRPPAVFEAIGTTIGRRQVTRKPELYDEDRQILVDYLVDFGREFGDQAPKSSVSRTYKLYKASGLSRDVFLGRLYEARAITKERTGTIHGRKFPYFLSVLEDLLGLKADGARPASSD